VRFLFYSHDGLGLGHVRRNLAIADAVTRLQPSASVLLVSSSDHVDSLVVPRRVDILKLPGIRKVDNSSYEARRLGMTSAETWGLRSALLVAATRSYAPDVLLSDKHPYGAHGELRPALAVLHAAGGRAVLGLRDILDDPATVRAEWAKGGVHAGLEAYDRILVYGSPDVLDVAAAYALPARAAGRLHYCGYVASTPTATARTPLRADDDGRPTVVATAGGGADGYAMLDEFVRASRGAPWHPVVVSGTDAGEHQQEALRRDVTEIGGSYHRFVRNLPVHFPDIGALVCMGGYNTTAEALAAAVPTVVVPRSEPRQEQLIRARAFAGLGLLRMVDPEKLAAPVLSAAVHEALRDTRSRIRDRVDAALDLGGASRAAAHLLAVAGGLEDIPAAGIRLAVPVPLLPRRAPDLMRGKADVAV
jgi:predicted glycosyltransferase